MAERLSQPKQPLRPLTRFIGRRQERATLARVLGPTRLLTLTGSGGCGKTRLALAVSEMVAGNYTDGVTVIELAPIGEPALVPGAVAAMFGVREELGVAPLDALIVAMRDRATLLVLDNCEHLLVACATLAARLLEACPNLTILATSREALGVVGEVTWRVPPLTIPESRGTITPAFLLTSEAAQLFVDRAGARQPGFVVTHENASAVATICRRLDGMPLALELAAARIGTMPLSTIATRLDNALTLLTAGNRAAPLRQQTLRETLTWSHALLNEPERIVLRRLSVFAGGISIEAAIAVCADDAITMQDVPYLLARLVEQSLLLLEGESDTARYRLLETVRQYAAERLDEAGEVAAVHERHAAYFLSLTEKAKEPLNGSEPVVWIERLETDIANLRAALHWSRIAQSNERGLQLVANTWRYWYLRGRFTEALGWLSTFFGATDVSPQARLDALFAAGRLSIFTGNYDTAQDYLAEMIALGRLHDLPLSIASALMLLGTIALEKQAFSDSHALYSEALEYARLSGPGYWVAYCSVLVALPLIMLGEIAQADEIISEVLPLYLAFGDIAELTRLGRWLGIIAMEQGDSARSRTYFTDALTSHHRLHSIVGVAECLEGLAALAEIEGVPVRALVLAGSADTIRATIGAPCPPYWRDWLSPRLDRARLALGATASEAPWAAGAAMTLEGAIAYAVTVPSPPAAGATPRAGRRAAKQWYGGLTVREREIAALVAAGRSNREIASVLFIAEKTVETHVGHALRKLSFTARAQLARWAIAVDLATASDADDGPP